MGDKFTIKQFMSRLENGQVAYDKAMVTFQGRLQVNPVEAFRWVETQASLAVRAQVFNRYAKFLNDVQSAESGEPITIEEALKRVREDLERTVISKSRHVPNSTSAMDNFIELHETAAHAELLDEMQILGL